MLFFQTRPVPESYDMYLQRYFDFSGVDIRKFKMVAPFRNHPYGSIIFDTELKNCCHFQAVCVICTSADDVAAFKDFVPPEGGAPAAGAPPSAPEPAAAPAAAASAQSYPEHIPGQYL